MNAPITQPPENQVIGVAPFGVDGAYLLESTPMRKKPVICGIYSLTNPDGETYIGRSVDIYRRTDRYKPGMKDHQWKLKASIEKFGTYQHLIHILEECDEALLDEREVFYKKKLIAEKGWGKALFYRIHDLEPHRSTQKSVKAWSLDADYIGEFESGRLAAKKLKVEHRDISAAVTGRRRYAGDYQFRFSSDETPVVPITKKTRTAIPILQMKGGEVVAEHKSCYAAAKANGYPNGAKIQLCIHGQKKQYKGYQWKKK